jgi:hypothetical protein
MGVRVAATAGMAATPPMKDRRLTGLRFKHIKETERLRARCRRRFRLLGAQRHLLHSPVGYLADV